MLKETTIAYLAGIIDGEGYIGIKKTAHKNRVTPGFHARIQVRMIHDGAIRMLQDTFGGSIYKEKPHVDGGRPLACWQLSDAKAEYALRILLPYMVVKRENAENVLALRDLQTTSKQHRTKPNGFRRMRHWAGIEVKIQNKILSDEYVGWCDDLYEKGKRLNH